MRLSKFSDGRHLACVELIQIPDFIPIISYILCPHVVRGHPGRKQGLVAKLAGLSLLKTFIALLLIWFHRIRRIKCDEAKPSCTQCLRGRRICDGYPHRETSVSMSTMNPSGFSDLFKTDRERRSFEFFRRSTVSQLSGSFESPLWTHLVLLAAHHEPAVQHAAIALGALHECFEHQLSDHAEVNFSFALQQYVKAIGLVTKPIHERGKQAADVALMTCILFVCFEVSSISILD